HPPADRADDRAPRRRAGQRDDQGDAGRRARGGARPHWLRDREAAERAVRAARPRAPEPASGGAGTSERAAAGAERGGGAAERIPILKMGQYLLVTIQVDMHDRLALALQDDLTERIVRARARGVLIDISSLDVVDSFIGRMLGNIAAMSRVLDAETVVVGMRPAVAITLVELGVALRGIQTALNVDSGMALLRKRVDAAAPSAGSSTRSPTPFCRSAATRTSCAYASACGRSASPLVFPSSTRRRW